MSNRAALFFVYERVCVLSARRRVAFTEAKPEKDRRNDAGRFRGAGDKSPFLGGEEPTQEPDLVTATTAKLPGRDSNVVYLRSNGVVEFQRQRLVHANGGGAHARNMRRHPTTTGKQKLR